ncbi:YciI family protein [Oligoflexus tunisiensis]|uniref:YciI family protein n=1 Tax=Oligoflexus tunisiensis TaxID=708132 RepID=UPI00114CEA9E|nr:YciI family protein [Oligoflexus tunisiensis]
MKLFIYDLALQPDYQDPAAWDARVEEVFNQHADYLNQAIKHGRVMLVGRTDTAPKDNYGLVVFEAENQADAEEFMKGDPAIARGVMQGRAFPFKLLKVTDQARKWQAW